MDTTLADNSRLGSKRKLPLSSPGKKKKKRSRPTEGPCSSAVMKVLWTFFTFLPPKMIYIVQEFLFRSFPIQTSFPVFSRVEKISSTLIFSHWQRSGVTTILPLDRGVVYGTVAGLGWIGLGKEYAETLIQVRTSRVFDIFLMRDGGDVISCCVDGTIRVQEQKTIEKRIMKKYVLMHREGMKPCTKVTATVPLDQLTLACALEGGEICIWSLESGTAKAYLGSNHGFLVTSLLRLSPTTLAAAYSDNTVRIWKATTQDRNDPVWMDKKECDLALRHGQAVSAMLVMDGGKNLVCASHDGLLRIWNLSNGLLEYTLEGHRDKVTHLIHLSRNYIASGGQGKKICVWSLERKPVCIMSFSTPGIIYSITKLRNGNIAAGFKDCIWIWSLSQPAPRLKINQQGLIKALRVMQNGNLVSGSSIYDRWMVDGRLACYGNVCIWRLL